MTERIAERIAVLGVGLVGGSLALGARRRGLCGEVVGYDRSSATLEQALELGVLDAAANSVADAVSAADLIVLAVPVLSAREMLGAIRDALWQGAAPPDPLPLITDVGSVKGSLVTAAREVFDGSVPSTLVPGHPIAGSERHGVGAVQAELFEGHRVILTPLAETEPSATARVTSLWEALGAEVVRMETAHHDEVLAGTSHLPHLLAYALVNTLSTHDDSLEIFRYAAGGFRDFSRIAASDPTMWRDIFSANGAEVIRFLDRYMEQLATLREAMADGDTDLLIEVFERAKQARDHFTAINEERQAQDDGGERS